MAEAPTQIISEIHDARRRMLAGKAREALESLAWFKAPFATLSLVRGECHYVLGQWSDAVREFESAIKFSPNSPRAEIMLELSSEMVELSKTIRPAASVKQLLGVPNDVGEVPRFPKLSPSQEEDEETSEATISSDEIGLVSETLADVMIRQGKFDDARKVYIQLSRLNPDRYEYFRDKIKKLDSKTSV
ncbi:MAG TPA: tetratricopeptide repeat protein [Candidatus Kapabacteria bacterium]|nr:tetratricopeptide repeat protein [Candidatus Kapabacteria bacterium]